VLSKYNIMISTEVNIDRNFTLNIQLRKAIFIIATLICLLPVVSPPIALLLGLVLAQLMENPYHAIAHKTTNLLLKISVVGLGFGMNVFSAIKAGREGVLFTVASISLVFIAGTLAGKFFRTDKKTSLLISAGTAICGGSAIAAISPVIKADDKQISVALGAVFILNSIALFVFPAIGHGLHLSQTQFGLWCALAIHDTSSVIGAASKYGAIALQTATTVKLARALWIIPVAFITAFVFKTDRKNIRIPYFIGLFILAMLVNTYVPFIKPVVPYITTLAKTGLTVTLFLIGTSLSFKTLKTVGVKPLLQAVLLWVLISGISLWAVTTLS
jgi:uncharacterized integral membrane protein (TIGR00698 family)